MSFSLDWRIRAARLVSYTHNRTLGNRGASTMAKAVPQLPAPIIDRFFNILRSPFSQQ
jgi:hypothetical protein